MPALDRISKLLNGILMAVGGLCLVGMIGLTCANILFRMVWVPVPGTFELMGYAGAVVTAFALSHTQSKGGHISVDVLIGMFAKGTRQVLYRVNALVCVVFFALAAWQVAGKAHNLLRTGEISETLRIAYYPFTYAVALGCAVLALELCIGLVRSLKAGGEGGN